MPLDAQTGLIADRMRRFFGIVGRIPMQVDELIVPVVNLQSLAEPPWRIRDRAGSIYASQAAGGAALFSSVAFAIPTGGAGAFTARRWALNNGTGASVVLQLRVGALPLPGTIVSTAQLLNVENPTEVGAGPKARVSVDTYSHTHTAAIGSTIMQIQLADQRTEIFDWPVTVYPGFYVAWQNAVLNTGVSAAVWGEYFPGVST